MAFPIQIQSTDWKGLLDDVTQWLRMALLVQVLAREQQLVGSSTENDVLRTAHREAHGHALFSSYGKAFISVPESL